MPWRLVSANRSTRDRHSKVRSGLIHPPDCRCQRLPGRAGDLPRGGEALARCQDHAAQPGAGARTELAGLRRAAQGACFRQRRCRTQNTRPWVCPLQLKPANPFQFALEQCSPTTQPTTIAMAKIICSPIKSILRSSLANRSSLSMSHPRRAQPAPSVHPPDFSAAPTDRSGRPWPLPLLRPFPLLPPPPLPPPPPPFLPPLPPPSLPPPSPPSPSPFSP